MNKIDSIHILMNEYADIMIKAREKAKELNAKGLGIESVEGFNLTMDTRDKEFEYVNKMYNILNED